jgi:hypothetical protein
MEQLLLSAFALGVKLVTLFVFVSMVEYCVAVLVDLTSLIGQIRSEFIRESTHVCLALIWMCALCMLFPLLFNVLVFNIDGAGE